MHHPAEGCKNLFEGCDHLPVEGSALNHVDNTFLHPVVSNHYPLSGSVGQIPFESIGQNLFEGAVQNFFEDRIQNFVYGVYQNALAEGSVQHPVAGSGRRPSVGSGHYPAVRSGQHPFEGSGLHPGTHLSAGDSANHAPLASSSSHQVHLLSLAKVLNSDDKKNHPLPPPLHPPPHQDPA